MCEDENVKLLKKMSIVQGELTNKIDFFFPWQSYNCSFSLSFLAAEKFISTNLLDQLIGLAPAQARGSQSTLCA